MTYPKMKGIASSLASRSKRDLHFTSLDEAAGGSGNGNGPSSDLTEYEQLFSRIIKIMDCFKKHPDVYESLKVILRKRKKERKPIKQVRNEVALLLLNNLDLLEDALHEK